LKKLKTKYRKLQMPGAVVFTMNNCFLLNRKNNLAQIRLVVYEKNKKT